MRHDVFEPRGGKAGMSQLSCQGFCFKDSEAAPVGAPSGGECLPEGIKEVCWSVNGQTMCVDDVTQDAVDRSNGHLLEFIEGNGVLSEIQGGRAEEDEDGFDTGRCSLLDAVLIEEIDIYTIIDVN
jgi:hypothetical protein